MGLREARSAWPGAGVRACTYARPLAFSRRRRRADGGQLDGQVRGSAEVRDGRGDGGSGERVCAPRSAGRTLEGGVGRRCWVRRVASRAVARYGWLWGASNVRPQMWFSAHGAIARSGA